MLRTETRGPLTRIRLARTVAGRPLHQVSAYLLGDTLIDSGCPATGRELAAWCEGRGVRRVVHTHHHEDHIGGDAELVRRFGVEVLAPARTVPVLAGFYRMPLYRRAVWGRPRPVAAVAFGDEVAIDGRRFQVVTTPGHASDHVCLFDPGDGLLFTGDLYVAPRVRYLRAAEDAGAILAALRHLVALAPRVLACAHAGVVEGAEAALEARIAHWEEIAHAARRLRDAGLGERAVTRRLLGREGLLAWVSGFEFAKVNLVRSLLASGECERGEP